MHGSIYVVFDYNCGRRRNERRSRVKLADISPRRFLFSAIYVIVFNATVVKIPTVTRPLLAFVVQLVHVET